MRTSRTDRAPDRKSSAGRRSARPVTVAVAALAAIALLPGLVLAAELLQVTQSERVTHEDLAPTRTYASPSVLIDPDDPNTVVAGSVDMRTRRCHVVRSRDAGQTWTLLDASPSLESYPFCFNTSGITPLTPMAWGRAGTLYYGMTGWDTQDSGEADPHGGTSGNVSVLLGRSDDLGDSWNTVLVRDARGNEGEDIETNRPVPSIAVDTNSGTQDVVYVSWYLRKPQADEPRRPVIAVSTDAGETFSEPINVLDQYAAQFDEPEEIGGGAAMLTIDDSGTLYALFLASYPDDPRRLVVGRTSDQGETWEYTEFPDPAIEFSIAPMMAWSDGGGPDGTVHVAYEDHADGPGTGDRDIYYRRSTDGGESFSDAVKINDDEDPNGLFLQATPRLSVAPSGRVDLSWWDFRDDPGDFQNDVYYAWSDDHGASWSDNMRISDQSISRRIGPWTNGFDMRGPPGIGSANAFAVHVWDDTRLGNETTETQDLFAAVAQFEPLGPGALSNLLALVVAAMGGLAAVGLVLLIVARVSRPQASAPSDAEARQAAGT